MSKFSVTKRQCQELINRVVDGVCPGCGGKVTPMKTVDNAGTPTYWAGCERCCVFTHPVENIYFTVANNLLEDGEYIYISRPYKPSKEELGYWENTERRAVVSKLKKYLDAYNQVAPPKQEVEKRGK